ncbi:MAG: type ISP restriction/modification enzyme, partial [Myxococcota bacterium]|nr:type ISP restriction/modification enzyme [Myxococcota bacterium]
FVERPRREVMQHCIQKENIGLMLNKKIEVGKFHHAFLYSAPTESHALSLKEINYLFPLYTYENQRRTENIFRLIPMKIQKDLQLTKPPSGEEIIHYIYAILHHRTYRTNFYDFLIIDYPRIPYPKDGDTFRQLIEKGRSLRQIHLFESVWFKDLPSLLKNDDGTVAQTSQRITGLTRAPKIMSNGTVQTQRVYINRSQYFDEISNLVWNFYIGGYKPAQKWLKDRKGQTLSSADILHYTKIIKALEETARIMAEIEEFEVFC